MSDTGSEALGRDGIQTEAEAGGKAMRTSITLPLLPVAVADLLPHTSAGAQEQDVGGRSDRCDRAPEWLAVQGRGPVF